MKTVNKILEAARARANHAGDRRVGLKMLEDYMSAEELATVQSEARPVDKPVSTTWFEGSQDEARRHLGAPVAKLPGTGILHGCVSRWVKK